MLTGTNKFCQQCSKNCKQFSELKVVYYPNFLKMSEVEKEGTPHTGAKQGL